MAIIAEMLRLGQLQLAQCPACGAAACLAGGPLASSVSWGKLALGRISAGLSFCLTEEDVGRAGQAPQRWCVPF